MTKPILLTVNLPFFPGFYESWLSGEIDNEETRWCENVATESDHETDEPHWPETLRLDEGELGELLYRHTNYSAAYEKVAKWYVEAFDSIMGKAMGFTVADTRQRYNFDTRAMESEPYRRHSIRATFESMDSPREYNFATDRVYAHIPLAMMKVFFNRSKAEGHATLREVISARHTSRDGFISHYSNQLSEWLAKPLTDWDHNELGSLLVAAMRMAGVDLESDWEEIYYSTFGDEGAYQAWESSVDWPAFEAARAETRAEKLSEWLQDDKGAALAWRDKACTEFDSLVALYPAMANGLDLPEAPYRCPYTLDLFEGL